MVFTAGSEAYKLGGDVYRPVRAASHGQGAEASVRSSRSPARAMAMCACCVLVVFAMAVVYVAQHARMALLGDELHNAQQALVEAKAEYGHLKLRLMRLSSLERVEALARGEGRMVDPDAVRYVTIAKVAPVSNDAEPTKVETLKLNSHRLAKPAHVVEM